MLTLNEAHNLLNQYERVREHEAIIDKKLIEALQNGKTQISYTVEDAILSALIVDRYNGAGWHAESKMFDPDRFGRSVQYTITIKYPPDEQAPDEAEL